MAGQIAEGSFWRSLPNQFRQGVEEAKSYRYRHKWVLWVDAIGLAITCALIFRIGDLAPPWVTWPLLWIVIPLIGVYLYFIRELLIVVGWMWAPASVTVIAAVLLFASDQGADLGVGLLGSDYRTKYVLLALVLFYWAAVSWHAGRRSLDRRFPTFPVIRPEDTDFVSWLRWPPRLLGISAHLFAAVNLCLAASGHIASFLVHQTDSVHQTDWVRLAIWAPVVVLILGIILVWAADKKAHIRGLDTQPAEFSVSHRDLWIVGSASFAAMAAVLVVFMGAVVPELGFVDSNSAPPRGLLYASLAIFASAAVFLLCMRASGTTEKRSYAAQQRRDTRHLIYTAAGLAAAVAGWAAYVFYLYAYPLWTGQKIGSMVVAFFAFGAIISVIDAFSLPLDIALWKARRDPSIRALWEEDQEEEAAAAPKDGRQRLPFAERYLETFSGLPEARQADFLQIATFPVVCGFALLLAVGTSQLRTYNDIRMCHGNDCAKDSSPAPAERPTVEDAFKAWYAAAAPAWEKQRAESSDSKAGVPLVIVATAGGGIRAAYWTATVLDELRRRLSNADLSGAEPSIDRLQPYLFAISGVSGGSLGAAVYSATLPAEPADLNKHSLDDPKSYLNADFLAPALASLIFADGSSNLLPFSFAPDRGVALEKAFEAASRDKLAEPFLSFFPRVPFEAARQNWRPALLLNATHQETGRRIIESPVAVEKDIFTDAYDAIDLFSSDTRMSTAVMDSARFLYVSPPGRLPDSPSQEKRGYVLDGGYFENFGAQTALELVTAIERAAKDAKDPVRIIVLQISSDPSMSTSILPRLVWPKDGSNGAEARRNDVCKISTSGDAGATNFLRFTDARFALFKPDTWAENGDGEGPGINFVNELWSPLAGVMSTRESRGRADAEELAQHMCDRKAFFHLAMCHPDKPSEPHIVPPLGWVLSTPSRERIEAILGFCGNSSEMDRLVSVIGLKPPAELDAAEAAQNP
jgi:hypothetical protein